MEIGMTIGLLTGITIWWLLVRRLRDKPWTEKGIVPASQDSLTSNPAKVGLVVFLAAVTSLFLIFNSAYLMRMEHSGSFAPWVPVDEPRILWLNTLVLALASVTMQLATRSSAKGDVAATRTHYTAAGVLTMLFLAGQLAAWRQLSAAGLSGADTPAYAFFVLLTAVHGLHLLGGLCVLATTAARVWSGAAGMTQTALASVRQSVQLTTTYWHFLLIVWFGLFTLLSLT